MVRNLIRKSRLKFLNILITYVITIAFIPLYGHAQEHSSVKGELDLRKVSLDNGSVKLSGEWQFYWENFLDYNEDTELSHIVSVPNEWRHYSGNEQLFAMHGFGTYRLKILLNEKDVDQVLSFYIPSIASSYQLKVNGQLLTKVGKIGESRPEVIPGNEPQIVTFKPNSELLQLDIQVSNFHQRKAGLWSTIVFGKAEEIIKYRENRLIFQMFVIGCIFIIGFYHVTLYINRPQEKSALYLAIGCFFIMIRTLILKENIFFYILPGLSWEIAVRLEYIAALIALLSFYLFFQAEILVNFPIRFGKWIIYIIFTYTLFILMTPSYVFTNTFIIFQLIIFIVMFYILIASYVGIKQKKEGATLTFIAIIILCATVLNDLFHYNNYIFTDELVSVGFLFYLFVQSIHLARKTTYSYESIGRLTNELKLLNQSLEKKVKRRTKKLREVNSELRKTELARKRLFAIVSHELSTPLTSIQGYTKAMLDEVVPKNNSIYLRMIYNDSQLMGHLIKDLSDLSSLESGQVKFNFQLTEMKAFSLKVYKEQKHLIERANISLVYEDDTEDDVEIFCMIDHLRLRQVLINLIMNAKKFTPDKREIVIKVSTIEYNRKLKISVIDNGIGISDTDLPHVFERFYKANNVNQSVKGVGLGLAIVKEIIEYHKGTIDVTSILKEGSIFYFTLPIKMYN